MADLESSRDNIDRQDKNIDQLNEIDKQLVEILAEEQATKESTAECIKTFFRQIRFFKRTRKYSLYIVIVYTILLPY